METIQLIHNTFEKMLDKLSPWMQGAIAFIMGLFAHMDIMASFVALMVLLYQLKISYYKGKTAKVEYDKACQEVREK